MTWSRVVIAFSLLALGILVLSLIDGFLSPSKVGTGGAWYAGIAGATVLAWTVGEDKRHRQRDRESRTRLRSEAAVERAVRAIVASGIRPGEDVSVEEQSRPLYNVLEVERQVIASQELADRMRSTTAALMVAWQNDKALESRDLKRIPVNVAVKRIVEECNGSLLAYWREDPLPDWDWPEHDGIEDNFRQMCAE